MCTDSALILSQRPPRGVTLIELVIFLVVISTGLSGILMAMQVVGRHSADPLVQRQELAVAETLLSEVELQPFTTCDPAGPPLSVGGACVIAQGLGAVGRG